MQKFHLHPLFFQTPVALMNSQSVYRLRRVQQIYNGRAVLDVPELDIGKGELLAIVGPSGAGKSTLLRLLHFLEPPTNGTIAYREFAPGYPLPLPARRTIAMVFQRPELLHRSVGDNVRYGLRIRGMEDESRIREALSEVGLSAFADVPASTLSGGEVQRVALARVLVLRPDVLLLDEPTANLDPRNVALVEGVIQRMRAQANTTVVLVTHNVFQARRLADRVAFLLGGKLIELSDAEKFFNEPDDPRSRAFVRGEMVY